MKDRPDYLRCENCCAWQRAGSVDDDTNHAGHCLGPPGAALFTGEDEFCLMWSREWPKETEPFDYEKRVEQYMAPVYEKMREMTGFYRAVKPNDPDCLHPNQRRHSGGISCPDCGMWFPPMREPPIKPNGEPWKVCTRCGKGWAGHIVYHPGKEREDLCCRCHVKDGGAPAEWHHLCMKAYQEAK